MAAIKLFGFTLGSKDIVQKEKPEQASFALKTEALDDGAVTITQNAHYGTYVDLEGAVRNELELITRYREMANHPECDQAITEIVDEAITHEKDGTVVDIKMDNLKQPDSIKKKIAEEFQTVAILYAPELLQQNALAAGQKFCFCASHFHGAIQTAGWKN